MSASPRVSRTIAVCADDFGLHEGVNRAVLELTSRGLVSTVSCMVDGPDWSTGVAALRDRAQAIEVGLHLNFTEPFPRAASCHPLRTLLALAYSRRMDRAAVAREIQRQLAEFEVAFGRPPDFVDGHQHVHQLPVIREALLDVLAQRYPGRMPWLRATSPVVSPVGVPLAARLKARVIAALGSFAFRRLAESRGFQLNRRFLGVYGFDRSEPQYLQCLAAWLESVQDGDLLMCHPSSEALVHDPILHARKCEFDVLGSDGFRTLTTRLGVRIAPYSTTAGISRGPG